MGISSNLLASMYKGWPVINREATGFVSALNIDSDVTGLAVGDKIKVFRGDVGAVKAYTQGMAMPDENDPNMPYVEVTLDHPISTTFSFTGEEEHALVNSSTRETAMDMLFKDSFRKLSFDIEKYAAGKIIAGSRAYGTAGTTPFGTANNLTDFAQVNKILDDNGCPKDGRQLVLSNEALANLRGNMSNLFKVNEAGTEMFLREGYAGSVQGLFIRNSAGLLTHEKGTGSGYLVNGAVAVNGTSIALDTGSGKIVPGDIVTFGSDTNKYVVDEGIEAAGNIVIGNPGALNAIADNAAVTIGASYTPNIAFQKDSVAFGARPPKIPQGGDGAIWHETVTDPYTGIPYLVSCYPGHGKNVIEVATIVGCKVIESANVAVLLG